MKNRHRRRTKLSVTLATGLLIGCMSVFMSLPSHSDSMAAGEDQSLREQIMQSLSSEQYAAMREAVLNSASPEQMDQIKDASSMDDVMNILSDDQKQSIFQMVVDGDI